MSNIIFNKPIKYREICEMMGDKEKKGGKDRKYQLIQWQKKYEIEKNKTWYIIKRELTLDEQDNLKSILIKDKKMRFAFNVKKYKDKHKSGIYIIQNGNYVYIGQTKDFYKRFYTHWNCDRNTGEMLRNGGKFSILEICEDDIKRKELELKYIIKYEKDKNYNCINFRGTAFSRYEEIKNKKCLYVKEQDYERAIKILQINEIDV